MRWRGSSSCGPWEGAVTPRVRPEGVAPLVVSGPSLARRVTNVAWLAGCGLAAAVVIVPLALIVSQLLARGLPALSWGFFVHMPQPVGEPGGGMANAILGTAILLVLGAIFAIPVGVAAGI